MIRNIENGPGRAEIHAYTDRFFQFIEKMGAVGFGWGWIINQVVSINYLGCENRTNERIRFRQKVIVPLVTDGNWDGAIGTAWSPGEWENELGACYVYDGFF